MASSRNLETQMEPPALPVALRPRDVTVLFILMILTIFGAGQVHAAGMVSLLYWLLGCCTFLLPCAYVTYWLTSHFPGRGGHYLWATRIMGTHWGFSAAFSAWLPCVFSVISTLGNCLILIETILPSQQYKNAWQPLVCLFCVMLLATIASCLPLRRLKYYLFVAAAIYLATLLFIGSAGIWWLAGGHHAAHAVMTPATFHLNSESITTYGLVVLVLLGVDLPLFMNGEMRDKQERHVKRRGRTGRFLLLGVVLVSVAYFVQAWSISIVLPLHQTDTIPMNIQVVQTVFGPSVTSIVALLLLVSQAGTISAYLLVASRILILLAQDRRLPVSLTLLNKQGVPLRSVITQAVITIVLAVSLLVAIPAFLSNVLDPTLLSKAIYVMLQSSASLLLIFLTGQLFLFALRCLFRQGENKMQGKMRWYLRIWPVLRRVRQRSPLIVSSIIGLLASLFGIWAILSHSSAPGLLSDEYYALLVVAFVVFSLSIAWVICEVLRVHSLLREQRRLNEREVALRSALEEANHELEISVSQQNELIFEVDRLYREQAQAAITDAVTGLPNHRAVMSHIDEEIARCERTHTRCVILFLDIDHFKRVNDTWGHRAGDAILREVAMRLRSAVRTIDFVGRYGGEEFALLLPETDVIGANEVAERLRLAIASQPCIWQSDDGFSNATIVVTVSIGIAAYGMHGTTREQIVECADQAMYRAKQGGRNLVCIADLSDESEDAQAVVVMPTQTEMTTVQVLSAAAHAHDHDTDDHAHRMVALAEATARELHLSNEEIHLIRLGALLHDIGKIGIPDAILHKPGPLTSDEWDIMRLHPEIGQHILAQAGGVFQALANIVVTHHERWDGKGYPFGLARETIPLASRILTVIDSYDAMTSRRVYRGPMSPLAARDELQRCSGSQYDPDVVAAFLHVLDTHDIIGSLLIPYMKRQEPMIV